MTHHASADGGKHSLRADAFESRSFSWTAASLLRRMILTGEFQAGERLNELAISNQLRISRSPIREALQILAGEGLVRFVPGRGAFVMEFDLESIEQLAEARIALESHAAARAANLASSDDIELIAQVLRQAKHAIDSGEMDYVLMGADDDVLQGADYPRRIDVHRAILAAAHSPRLTVLAEGAVAQFRLARAHSGRKPSWAPLVYTEHFAIFEAIRSGDAEGARAAMTAHLCSSRDLLIEHIRTESDDPGGR